DKANGSAAASSGSDKADERVPLIALVLRGDHQLNEIKAAKLAGVRSPLTFASDAQIEAALACTPGSIGPVGLSIPVIADHGAAVLADFVCGANEDGFHLQGTNWERDCTWSQMEDL